MEKLFVDIGIIIIASALLAYVAHRRKQPLILAYLVAGVAIGPVGIGLLADVEKINTLSEIGIAFLLFIVGLELDLRKMKSIGKPVIAAGLGQVIITFTVGYLLSRYLGVPQIPSFYVSLGLTLSSTVLVVKLLSDRNEINTLHANLAVGILLVQDLIAMIALAVMPNLSYFAAIGKRNNSFRRGSYCGKIHARACIQTVCACTGNAFSCKHCMAFFTWTSCVRS